MGAGYEGSRRQGGRTYNLAPSRRRSGGTRISLKNSTPTRREKTHVSEVEPGVKAKSMGYSRKEAEREGEKPTFDAMFSSTRDLSEHDLSLEGTEDDESEFYCHPRSERELLHVEEEEPLPFTLTSPVPWPIRPSEDSSRS